MFSPRAAQHLCVPYFPALKPPIFTPFPHSDISKTLRMPNPLTHVEISWFLSNFGSFEESLPKTSLSKLLCGYQFSTPGDLQLCSIRVPSSSGVRNCPTLPWSGYNVLNSHQQWVRVPVVSRLAIIVHEKMQRPPWYPVLSSLTSKKVTWCAMGSILWLLLIALDWGHGTQPVAVRHCCFNVRFSHEIWCNLFIFPFVVFVHSEVSTFVCELFLNWIFFLIVEF